MVQPPGNRLIEILIANEIGQIISPKDRSDRTCLLNVGRWICRAAKNKEDLMAIKRIVLALAQEAANLLPETRLLYLCRF
jgi:hypothetical protein